MGATTAKASNAIRAKRARAFRDLFDLKGPNAKEAELVLAALRDFCRANVSTTGRSDQETYLFNGRRDVWLYVNDQLNFDERTVMNFREAHDEYFDEHD